MNYIKLKLGGKERGAKLGLLFLENALKAQNMNIQELVKEFEERNLFFTPKLIYHSLVTNCQLSGQEVDFTIEDVYDWVEEDGVGNEESALVTFVNAFAESMKKIFPDDIKESNEGKQKPTKRVSTPTSGSKK